MYSIPLLLSTTTLIILTSALTPPPPIPSLIQPPSNETPTQALPHNNTTHSILSTFPPPPFRYPVGPSLDIIINSYSIITSFPIVSLGNTLRYIREAQRIMNGEGQPSDYFPVYKFFMSGPFQIAGARLEFAAKRPFTINRDQASRVLDTLVDIEETFGPAQLGSVDIKLDGEIVSRMRFDIFG